MDDFDSFDGQIEALEGSLGDAAAMVAGFDGALRRMQQSLNATGQDAAALEKSMNRGLRRAFDGLVFDGAKLSDVMSNLAQNMVNAAYRSAVRPVQDQLGEVLAGGVGNLLGGLLPFADGAGFTQGRVMPFANGGVVSGPVSFPMRGGRGLMGEAGPEAILPLSRGPDGKLGVRSAQQAGPVQVVMNISTPDAESFQRSRGQIATQMSRALARAQRNR
ncbi:phage tail tape measure protein [Shimia sp. MMG029]|uniref:phage tail tape measure protein n=1 Tax=Shimia sp. MMG029 TaxID=3021978 RepID=UPI0022FEB573|nr:phage tail tape measure protein [Shimia sp. MMG029]MDA5555629.1 phage tail tape measure protein [Shimia sp. MMG029]